MERSRNPTTGHTLFVSDKLGFKKSSRPEAQRTQRGACLTGANPSLCPRLRSLKKAIALERYFYRRSPSFKFFSLSILN
ncbi:hypothetical protein CKA32_004533 [Geitlerinema sp. FC II]|nr:hypothetical protein CKA32_004533 [Geitlerinema sp. FC II]